MPRLESLYLDPAQAGVPWLLDPDNPDVMAGLRHAATRRPTDPCDAGALAADIPDVLRLLLERHFGLATGIVAGDGLDDWADRWRHRLVTEQPATWGQALGADIHHLRHLIGDAHAGIRGEDLELLATVNPRLAEPVADDTDGPIVEEHVIDGVLALRIRRFGGHRDDEDALTAWSDAHERHFTHDRIVVDVRSNGGGGTTFCRDWMAEHLPAAAPYEPDDTTWKVGDRLLGAWNIRVGIVAEHGPAAVPQLVKDLSPRPHPDATLTIGSESDNKWLPAGTAPWSGRMLVVTDRRSGSAAEAATWMLRTALGAKVIGSRSHGSWRYGQVTPYLLARSGLVLNLAAYHQPFEHELVGIPVDVELDPRTPLADIAAGFDQIHAAGTLET